MVEINPFEIILSVSIAVGLYIFKDKLDDRKVKKNILNGLKAYFKSVQTKNYQKGTGPLNNSYLHYLHSSGMVQHLPLILLQTILDLETKINELNEGSTQTDTISQWETNQRTQIHQLTVNGENFIDRELSIKYKFTRVINSIRRDK